jgi:hypothetical protein
MWNNIVESDRPQMTIRRMRTACWIPKATNTDSQYVPNTLLLFHGKCYANAPQPTLPVLLIRMLFNTVKKYRKQEKPRMRWFDSIKKATGLRLEDLREAVQDRKKWRTLVEEKTRNRVRTNVK